MKRNKNIIRLFILFLLFGVVPAKMVSKNPSKEDAFQFVADIKEKSSVKLCVLCVSVLENQFESTFKHRDTEAHREINTKEIIFDHLQDAYWWHITTINDRPITVYLPVIIYSSQDGLVLFSSSHLAHGNTYKGFYIADTGKNAGKIVRLDETGKEILPIDLSLTKTATALVLNSAIVVALFLALARRYKKRPKYAVPNGFAGMMEMFVMFVEDDIIRKSIGKDYARYSPYLLTAFFFILINNLMGIIPFFPGGANVTGNIAITAVLALCTFAAVNLFGNKAYWKDIFWPKAPVLLKAPVPLMPLIEFFGIFTKPFALAIRLFANMTAGHTIILALTCLIFTTVKMGVAVNTGMTIISVLFALFVNLLEILVAFLQAYVFTLLSAVFIGLSRQEHKQLTINNFNNK